MKQLPSKHAFHEKEHPNFISLVSLILLSFGLLFLLCPLAFCHLPDKGNAPMIYHASAREKEQEDEKGQISDAVFLSRNSPHQISLSPYGQKYYYVVFQENYILKILSGSTSIQVAFYSQNGNQMHILKKNHQYHFDQASGDTPSAGDRVFIKFSNASTSSCAIKVQYKKSFAKISGKKIKATPKPKKCTNQSKKNQTQKKTRKQKKIRRIKRNTHTTDKPAPKATSPAKKSNHTPSKPLPDPKRSAKATPKPSPDPALTVKPHFLRLPMGSKKELSLSLGKSPLSLSDCTYYLTDSSLATIQGNAILGEKEGIAILYFRARKSSVCGSCLIRVTKY